MVIVTEWVDLRTDLTVDAALAPHGRTDKRMARPTMADEILALSPISARAALPDEADYAAICEAIMETSRGRWFLTEYARRNRNADTTLVLGAMARLESALARQKDTPAPPDLAPVTNALAAAQTQFRQFSEEAAPLLESLQLAAQMVQGVAWTLRERGYDGRLCDLLSTQASIVREGCAHPALSAGTIGVAVLDEIMAGIAATSDPDPVLAGDAETAPRGIDNSMQTMPPIPDDDIVPEAPASPSKNDLAQSVEQILPLPDTPPASDRNGGAERTNEREDKPAAPRQTLGEAIISAGLVTRVERPRVDPMAAFAKMSQAERIAFFS